MSRITTSPATWNTGREVVDVVAGDLGFAILTRDGDGVVSLYDYPAPVALAQEESYRLAEFLRRRKEAKQ